MATIATDIRKPSDFIYTNRTLPLDFDRRYFNAICDISGENLDRKKCNKLLNTIESYSRKLDDLLEMSRKLEN